MSDQRILQLQRTWEVSRTLSDAAALDEAARRAGFVSQPRKFLLRRLAEVMGLKVTTYTIEIPNGRLEAGLKFRGAWALHNGTPLYSLSGRQYPDAIYALKPGRWDYRWIHYPELRRVDVILNIDYAAEHLMPGDIITIRLLLGRHEYEYDYVNGRRTGGAGLVGHPGPQGEPGEIPADLDGL